MDANSLQSGSVLDAIQQPKTSWILEVVDSFGNSTVFDEEFATDAEALSYVIDEIERDGIEGYIGSANSGSFQ